jgi:hypothetical protein
MSDTPETDKNTWSDSSEGIFTEVVSSDFARRLERERDDYMERCRTALSERDSWRMRAEQKYAMRRELEELLGVDRNDASDEQFQKGLDAIKNIIGERDEAREKLDEEIKWHNRTHQELVEAQCKLLDIEHDKLKS